MIITRSTLMLLLMAAVVSVALFAVKYRVQDLDQEMREITRATAEAQESIHVLKSEWSHLNQPDRLRLLAQRYLEVGPLDADRVGDVDHMLSGLVDKVPAEQDDTAIDVRSGEGAKP